MADRTPRGQGATHDVTERRRCSGDNHNITRVTNHIILHTLEFSRVQSLAKPNYAGAHKFAAFLAFRNTAIALLSLVLLLAPTVFALRTPGNKNISANLDNLFLRQLSALRFRS